jgi:hydrogenase expression/formation protein HypC
MCLAVPMKIVSVDSDQAVVELGGVRRRVRLDLVEGASVGMYGLIHAGFVISLLSETYALETLEYLSGGRNAPS